MIEKYIGKSNTFPDDWKKVVFKTPVDVIRQLAIATHEYFQKHKKGCFSPLLIAATHGNLQLTQHIIGKMENLNAKEKYGSIPLYFAASHGHFEIC